MEIYHVYAGKTLRTVFAYIIIRFKWHFYFHIFFCIHYMTCLYQSWKQIKIVFKYHSVYWQIYEKNRQTQAMQGWYTNNHDYRSVRYNSRDVLSLFIVIWWITVKFVQYCNLKTFEIIFVVVCWIKSVFYGNSRETIRLPAS